MRSDWLATYRLSAVIIWTAPGYEQACALIGFLLTGHQLLFIGCEQACALIGSLLIGYQLLLYRQPLGMSKRSLASTNRLLAYILE